MWPVLLIVSVILMVGSESMPGTGIHRETSEADTSMGYKVVYGDEDLKDMNELVENEKKRLALKHKKEEQLKMNIDAVDINDLKCLVLVDRFCSVEMKEMKSVMIQAVQEDCKKCTQSQKEKAGKTIAALMAHDPVAWKLFLTRYAGRNRIESILG